MKRLFFVLALSILVPSVYAQQNTEQNGIQDGEEHLSLHASATFGQDYFTNNFFINTFFLC